jgi:Short C-terminal domain
VKEAFFESAEAQPRAQTTRTTPGPEPATDDAATKLRQLAQLHNSGVINEADFEAKEDELLSRM